MDSVDGVVAKRLYFNNLKVRFSFYAYSTVYKCVEEWESCIAFSQISILVVCLGYVYFMLMRIYSSVMICRILDMCNYSLGKLVYIYE